MSSVESSCKFSCYTDNENFLSAFKVYSYWGFNCIITAEKDQLIFNKFQILTLKNNLVYFKTGEPFQRRVFLEMCHSNCAKHVYNHILSFQK